MATKKIHFFRRGELITLPNVPPTRMLLEVLREDLGCTGTKEGCAEGDCGACTVVIGEALIQPGSKAQMRYRAINSCIRPAHSVDGLAVWTVEDIAGHAGQLHPAQQAMVDCHGSQCGFCTPGFVMSLFGMYQNHVAKGAPVSRALAQEELSGNLCRCTGYRPILDAAQKMHEYPRAGVDEQALLKQLNRAAAQTPDVGDYMLPSALDELLRLRAKYPHAQIVAGCTDVGLWVNKLHMEFDKILDVTRVTQLREIKDYPHHIAIGAAASLQDAFGALITHRPHLKNFASRFAGLPVRNSGTLGGNIANGSPIGDSMPLLIALGANVVLMRWQKGKAVHRELPLDQFYTGYRKSVLAADEVLAWIKVPKPSVNEFSRAYKISKRYDDDISAVCLAIRLELEDGKVAAVGIGAGGVAATPARARATEALLRGQLWSESLATQAADALRKEFAPISDMRASADYRRAMLGSLMRRFWLESQGGQHINLESDAILEAL
ncbi:MAG: xanthine dehydrogenase small subunit [Pseudomonadota bacterium]|jgi:xanthine dehydrogenase small subunit